MSFLKLAFYKRPLAEGETPFELFERLRGRSALLMRGGENGRFTFIAYDPFARVWSRDGVTSLLPLRDFCGWKKAAVRMFEEEPLAVLRELVRDFRFGGKSPVPFCGGVAGYFSYDFGARLMGVDQKVHDDLELPDFVFFFMDKVLAVDHEKRELFFLSLASTDMEAERRLETMEHDLQSSKPVTGSGAAGKTSSNLSFPQYEKKIAEVKLRLREGDTYQVNFSQRFSGECTLDGWTVFRELSNINPAPYACFFDCGDFQIISSSPELLFSKQGSRLVTRPIKGTVPRGKDDEEDENNIKKLLASKKDEAELAMIVDLERNDLGKVCDAGSVKVTGHRDVERYATVIHTVSTVEGKLLHGRDFFDVVEAMFPGGSITGCPKKRTMEIIDDLEDFRRGVYTGSAGYLGFDGNGALNILIRTMLLKDGKIYFHAGGGIVMDSDPKLEYEETLHKSSALNGILSKSR